MLTVNQRLVFSEARSIGRLDACMGVDSEAKLSLKDRGMHLDN